MWRYYLPIILIALGIIVYIYIKYRKKPIIFAPSPEKKYLIMRIPNTAENETKHYSLDDNHVVCVFMGDELIDTVTSSEFSISNYANNHDLSTKDNQFKKYHFYIFDNSTINNLGLKMETQLKFSDYEYSLPISVMPKGSINLTYDDIATLFKKLNLFRDAYTYTQFFDELRGRLHLLVSRGVISFCYESKISSLLLNYYLDDIDSYLRNIIEGEMTSIGLNVSKFEFIEFVIDQTDELKKIDGIVLQKQKYQLLNYSYVDERKIQLMKTIKFKQKASLNKSSIIEDVKKSI